MKKIFLLLSIVSVLGLTGCSNDDDRTDFDTYPETFNTPPLSFTPDQNGRYSYLVTLNPPILESDVVSVYRKTVDDGFTVWEPIPTTLYLPNGSNPDLEIDYRFNFTTQDVQLYMQATFDLATAPQYTQNQVFKIVLIPGYVAKNLNSYDYDVVMAALKEAKAGREIETIK